MSKVPASNAAIVIVAALLTVALRQGGYLDRLEQQADDARARILKREVASDVVVVGIDAQSLTELHSWPWPRRYHAQLLEKLRAANPRRVFLDIDFSAPSNRLDDVRLQTELAQWSRSKIILPTFIQPASGADTRLVTTQPLPAFAQHAQLAAVNQLPDGDGLVRRFRSTWDIDGYAVPSAAMRLSTARIAPNQSLLIDYSIALPSFGYLSYSSVLKGDYDPEQLAGKTVIVCATASELNDMLSVPQYRSLAGGVVQALAAQTLTEGALRELPTAFYALALTAWAALCVFLFARHSWQRNIPLLIGAVTLPSVVAVGFYASSRTAIEIIPWVLIAMLSLAAITVRALDRETLRALTYALGIRRRDALMASIVESSIDGIVCIDQQGSILSANPAATRILGRGTAPFNGLPIARFIPGFAGLTKASSSSRPTLIEGEAQSLAGRTFPLEYSVCRVGLQERQTYTVILRDISDRRAQDHKLRYQALHDSLTMLPNRAAMSDHLERALTLAKPGEAVVLMMLDLCRFKELNDTLGHGAGDAVLKEVAARFRMAVGSRGLLARIGGDEFAVVIDRQPTVGTEESLAEALNDSMLAPFHAGSDGSVVVEMSVSIGIARYPQHAADAATLLKNADIAMYLAKRRASRFEYYDATKDEHSVRKLTMVAELRGAIARQELQLYYQPQVNLHSGRVESAEALLRWPNSRVGEISPAEFIGIAESTDLIQPLTHWALRQALQQIAEWQRGGFELRVAVNLSARMLQDQSFPEQLRGLLSSSGVAAAALELEITESAMMLDAERAQSVVNAIHALGVMVSVDDYGTGYSSLGYLRDLPIHALKLDKSFVLPMRERSDIRAIVESTVQLAHALRLKVVAEGVETAWHAQALAAAGYDYGQGYYFSRARPAASFIAWLQEFDSGSAASDLIPMAGAA